MLSATFQLESINGLSLELTSKTLTFDQAKVPDRDYRRSMTY